MPPGSSGKAVERGRKDERSIATLVQDCRDLADHSADIAAASGAAELEHIEASNISGRRKAQAYKNLRARLLYALRHAEDHGAMKMLPPLVPQALDSQSSAAGPSRDVVCNAANNTDSTAAMGSSAGGEAEMNDATGGGAGGGAGRGSSHDDISRHADRLEVSVGAFWGCFSS
jgi:hypothetical protein